MNVRIRARPAPTFVAAAAAAAVVVATALTSADVLRHRRDDDGSGSGSSAADLPRSFWASDQGGAVGGGGGGGGGGREPDGETRTNMSASAPCWPGTRLNGGGGSPSEGWRSTRFSRDPATGGTSMMIGERASDAKMRTMTSTMARASTLCEGSSAARGPQPMHPAPHQAFTESLLLERADRANSKRSCETGASVVVPDAGEPASEDTANVAASFDAASAVGDSADEGGDAYPNFSRHGRAAVLPAYLTPDVYDALRGLRTPLGVTIEDCIRAGVALPHGARPPRGLAGVYAGDADSYRVFADLFVPLLRDYHQSTEQRHLRRTQLQPQHEHEEDEEELQLQQQRQQTTRLRLQRHQTNLNYSYLVKDTLDPEGEYILYTRMRLARSISGFRFPPCVRRGERRQVERLLVDVVKDWPGRYVSVMDMSNSQHDHLIQQQLLFKDPDEFLLTAGFGRDWPDARGIYCDTWQDTPTIIIWCNAEDHLWIISHGRGGNVQGVFTELSKAVGKLEGALKERNRSFVEDAKYGFLNASPANIGTALRASVYVKLVRLSRHPGFFDLVTRLRLEARSDYSQADRRFTGIYDIANAEALGKSEVDLINIMIRGVGFLIELEKKLERGEAVDLETVKLPAS